MGGYKLLETTDLMKDARCEVDAPTPDFAPAFGNGMLADMLPADPSGTESLEAAGMLGIFSNEEVRAIVARVPERVASVQRLALAAESIQAGTNNADGAVFATGIAGILAQAKPLRSLASDLSTLEQIHAGNPESSPDVETAMVGVQAREALKAYHMNSPVFAASGLATASHVRLVQAQGERLNAPGPLLTHPAVMAGLHYISDDPDNLAVTADRELGEIISQANLLITGLSALPATHPDDLPFLERMNYDGVPAWELDNALYRATSDSGFMRRFGSFREYLMVQVEHSDVPEWAKDSLSFDDEQAARDDDAMARGLSEGNLDSLGDLKGDIARELHDGDAWFNYSDDPTVMARLNEAAAMTADGRPVGGTAVTYLLDELARDGRDTEEMFDQLDGLEDVQLESMYNQLERPVERGWVDEYGGTVANVGRAGLNSLAMTGYGALTSVPLAGDVLDHFAGDSVAQFGAEQYLATGWYSPEAASTTAAAQKMIGQVGGAIGAGMLLGPAALAESGPGLAKVAAAYHGADLGKNGIEAISGYRTGNLLKGDLDSPGAELNGWERLTAAFGMGMAGTGLAGVRNANALATIGDGVDASGDLLKGLTRAELLEDAAWALGTGQTAARYGDAASATFGKDFEDMTEAERSLAFQKWGAAAVSTYGAVRGGQDRFGRNSVAPVQAPRAPGELAPLPPNRVEPMVGQVKGEPLPDVRQVGPDGVPLLRDPLPRQLRDAPYTDPLRYRPRVGDDGFTLPGAQPMPTAPTANVHPDDLQFVPTGGGQPMVGQVKGEPLPDVRQVGPDGVPLLRDPLPRHLRETPYTQDIRTRSAPGADGFTPPGAQPMPTAPTVRDGPVFVPSAKRPGEPQLAPAILPPSMMPVDPAGWSPPGAVRADQEWDGAIESPNTLGTDRFTLPGAAPLP